ncbi:hypothetical protein EZ428_18525 [Pedobacter frigiditerrae]|uniref:DUF5655 domain-containing protein n=1 Tax=Pedobacter frigiditerrae TaxID=2530452 RepID=A0A4R0MPR2_9SPHI|nr:DUF5655 domain-containing protein [Pedobacter frigiditerrae]TCC88633.1 hypothetical protein EZ428_18525 [Pedobacter frigiditerrae]
MQTCPKCERELRNPNQWHNCVKVNIGDLFKNKAEELEFIFDRLLAEIIDWENIVVGATKNCVVFVHHKTFLIVRPMKTQLDIKFYSEREQNDFPIIKSLVLNTKHENHIRISSLDELTTEIYGLIKQSYQMS